MVAAGEVALYEKYLKVPENILSSTVALLVVIEPNRLEGTVATGENRAYPSKVLRNMAAKLVPRVVFRLLKSPDGIVAVVEL